MSSEEIYGVNVKSIMDDNRLTAHQIRLLINLIFLCNEDPWRNQERPLPVEYLNERTRLSVGEIQEDIKVLKQAGYIHAEVKKQMINGRERGHPTWHIRLSERILSRRQEYIPLPQQSETTWW